MSLLRGATILCIAAMFARPIACRRPAISELPADKNGPSPTLTDTESPEFRIEDFESEPDPGWLRIEAVAGDAQGAWATGAFVAGNKIVIETQDVKRLALDLARIPVDWDRRAILRINRTTFELTRKHYPNLRLQRTPGGGWEAIRE